MFVINANSPVAFDDALPEATDVVVIGAGVIGIATAWFLREAGLDVTVCDKGRVAGEQSSRNWGWIRQQGRDEAELPIVTDSIRIWETLSRKFDVDIGFTRRGVLYLAETPDDVAGHEHWYAIAQRHGLDTCLLSGAEVDRLVADKPGQWRGGLFTPSDGRAEPFRAVPAFARAARARGVAIREDCAVRALDVEGGAVRGVVTEHGRIRADAVLCAGGAWSSLFLRNAGIELPQLTVRSTVARTAPAPEIFDGNAASHDLAFRRRDDGGYTLAVGDCSEHFVGADSFRYLRPFVPALRATWADTALRFGDGLADRLLRPNRWSEDEPSPFERARVLDPAPSPRALRLIRERLARRLPALADVPFAQSWAGMIDATPDFVPVMDAVPGRPGLFVATGFSGHGFGIGPGAGRVMADVIQGRAPAHDLRRFRFARFTDGSRLELGPVI